MPKYYARMMDAETGGEGAYSFDGPDNLMSLTADEIVSTFFNHVEHEVLHRHSDWEINGILKSRSHGVVTAIGSLIAEANDPPAPFLLLISDRNKVS